MGQVYCAIWFALGMAAFVAGASDFWQQLILQPVMPVTAKRTADAINTVIIQLLVFIVVFPVFVFLFGEIQGWG